MRTFFITVSALSLLSTTSTAAEPLKPRAEANWRYSSERAILMTEFWVPFAQSETSVFYGDYRMMGDNQDNREFNVGLGYRQITSAPLLGKGVAGVHGWFDHRLSKQGSKFNQITAGAEWLGDKYDVLLNAYVPLSDAKTYEIANPDAESATFTGTGIVVDTNAIALEEAQTGFDLELGWNVPIFKEQTDSIRAYGGAYYFHGEHTDEVVGARARFTADITEDFQIGARFQHDDERGSQSFLEATVRFPFGQKKSYRREGIRARLDDAPERDIDIVTGDVVTDPGERVAVINASTGKAQKVLHVDNSTGGGDGSADNPFNSLAAAQAAADAHTIIYVHTGTGDDTNQNVGITFTKQGQQLIGEGTNFYYNDGNFTTANGASIASPLLIAKAGTAPQISNGGGNAVTVAADNIKLAGFAIIDAVGGDGVLIEADGAGTSRTGIEIENISVTNARHGLYIHATNSGAASVKVQRSTFTGNDQHGVAVYDDTDGTFEVDLGGGELESDGNNVLASNTLEDLAVDYDGRTLAAMNNWWGQATGPDTDNPGVGIRPQIYYGAPINDGLVGHWTFDNEWMSAANVYDRSGNGNNGNYQGGLTIGDVIDGQNRQGLEFDGGTDHVTLPASNTLITGDSSFTLYTSSRTNQLYDTPNDNTGGRLIVLYTSNLGAAKSSKASSFYYGNNDDDLGLFYNSPANTLIQTDTNFNDNEFHNIAATYDSASNNAQIFFDTNTTGSSNIGVVSNAGSELARIGIFDPTGDGALTGVIDDARIYSRALTASEIGELDRMNTSSSINTGSFLTSAP